MKTGLAQSTLLVSFAIVGLSGCKNPQLCTPLGACGGDLLAGAVDFANNDGLVDRSWSVVGPAACQDQLQLPPVSIALARQPPAPANQRPPDPATADWCSGLVIKTTGEVKEFIPYAPPLPLKVGELTISADFDGSHQRGTYRMQTTIDETRDLTFSESCITAQGIRLQCPELGRQLGIFLKPEANIYSMRCQDPADPNQGGCECKFELSFIGGETGRWAQLENQVQINFFENNNNSPAALADYCFNSDKTLDLTGSNETPLFNEKGLRTLHMSPPSCHDGVQNLETGETGIDCGGACLPSQPCGTCLPNDTMPGCACRNGVKDSNEDGIDCGGACLGILCDPNPADPKNIHAACANNRHDPWESGVDCGGPCENECP
jgi:hypothetical protein